LLFLGADTNKGEEAIDAFSLGITKKLIPLSGARPGDAIVLPKGCWGCVGACLKGNVTPLAKEHCKRPRVMPPLPELLEGALDSVHASTDSSDSLALSLWRIAESSNVKIVIHKIPKPGFVSLEEALYSGEDYLPILVVDAKTASEVAKRVDGEVVGRVEEGKGVFFKDKRVEKRGWEWF
jgi:thiamine-monophosphate kinase